MARRFRGYLPVAIDVETGGFHATTDALLEIAAVLIDMDSEGLLIRGATHNFHVQPFEGGRLDPAALSITGIDPFHPLRPALPERDALVMAYQAIDGGAAGVDMGRNIFQSDHAEAMIRAPMVLPISTAVNPTPPAAPSTSSVSPACRWPRWVSAKCEVPYATGNAAAVTKSIVAGIGTTAAASSTISSA